MKTFGYIRKNENRNLVEQINNVQKYACDELFVEEQSYEHDNELSKLVMDYLGTDDCLIIESITAFGKNIRILAPFFRTFIEKNIRLISIEDHIDTNRSQNFFEIANLISKMDHQYHVTQTRHALSKAKEQGVKSGRPKIDEEKIAQITYFYTEKKYTLRKIAHLCSVSVGTVYKYVNELPENKIEEKHLLNQDL